MPSTLSHSVPWPDPSSPATPAQDSPPSSGKHPTQPHSRVMEESFGDKSTRSGTAPWGSSELVARSPLREGLGGTPAMVSGQQLGSLGNSEQSARERTGGGPPPLCCPPQWDETRCAERAGKWPSLGGESYWLEAQGHVGPEPPTQAAPRTPRPAKQHHTRTRAKHSRNEAREAGLASACLRRSPELGHTATPRRRSPGPHPRLLPRRSYPGHLPRVESHRRGHAAGSHAGSGLGGHADWE